MCCHVLFTAFRAFGCMVWMAFGPYNNNNNNLTCKAPVCAKKTSVALADNMMLKGRPFGTLCFSWNK